jgi:Zn finger protein HypA/HybF involved in hydrogenase expression
MGWTAADLAIAKEIRDVFFTSAPTLSVYIGAREAVTSTDATHVTVANVVRKVLGVWLATDTTFIGTNYYSDPKHEDFAAKVITLDSALPGAKTAVVVLYYSDCPTCEWDATRKKSRVTQCATCSGAGMTLADGTAVSIPAEKVRQGGASEPTEVTGETVKGNIVLRLKSEHEAIIRMAKRLVFDGRDLVIPESPKSLKIEPMYNLGVESVIKVYAEYTKY